MKRKLLWLMVGLLVGSGIAAASLVQARGGDRGNQSVQQQDGGFQEGETSEVEDADEAGDDDGPGDVED